MIIFATLFFLLFVNNSQKTLSKEPSTDHLLRNEIPGIFLCFKNLKYRSPDGRCNNLEHPTWGQEGSAYHRETPNDYTDGLSLPRLTGSNGKPLRSPRKISLTFNPYEDNPNSKVSYLFTFFASVILHDIDYIGQMPFSGNCCDEENKERYPCFPIEVPPGDAVYAVQEITCLDYKRMAPSTSGECPGDVRQIANPMSAYIDGEIIYGYTDKLRLKIREFTGGRLRSEPLRGQPFLPRDTQGMMRARKVDSTYQNFLAGDPRANLDSGTAVIHALFVLEHNRLAAALSKLNSHWQDERIFQEARKIVVAELQHITSSKVMEMLVGADLMKKYDLWPLKDSSDSFLMGYNKNVMAATGLAADMPIRLASMYQNDTLTIDGKGQRKYYPTNKQQLKPLYLDGPLAVLRGILDRPTQQQDRFYSYLLTGYGDPFSSDLVAEIIQQGRDVGLVPYIGFRKFCRLPVPSTWAELEQILQPGSVKILRKLYSSVEDVELQVAGVSERHIPGALFGPTFACLLAETIHRAKFGDRFWYEHEHLDGGFDLSQLAEIKKISLAQLICANFDIKLIQEDPFLLVSESNKQVACSSFEDMDLSHWIDNFKTNSI